MEEKSELVDDRIRVRRAFISVYDKEDLVRFAGFLAGKGVELYATAGTASHLRRASIPVTPAEDLTGFAELLSGKVKSLSPRLHAAILFSRESAEERKEIEENQLLAVDMVVVNFYPFHEAVTEGSTSEATKLIDIGGPAALRAAAKNFQWVVPVPEPASYEVVMQDALKEGASGVQGVSVSLKVSLKLAAATFAITARYDGLIESYFLRKGERLGDAESGGFEPASGRREPLPGKLPPLSETVCLNLKKSQDLRYGENPHQRAGLYVRSGVHEGLAGLGAERSLFGRQLGGKELSFNNLLDLDAAAGAVREFEAPACVIVKHRSPCGAARSSSLSDAYRNARDCDSLSAFGGVVAVNRTLTEEAAREMSKLFLELVAAPSFEAGAIEALSRKKNLRLVELSSGVSLEGNTRRMLLRSGPGGFLVQEEDSHAESPQEWRLVTRRALSDVEREGLFFLWKVARHVVSNAIVIGNGERTFGIGAGQTSRVDSVNVALMKARRAGHEVKGAWLASDGFFPFRDSIDVAEKAGICAIVQPGGSVRDEECIAAADGHDIAMYFTGRRCFKH